MVRRFAAAASASREKPGGVLRDPRLHVSGDSVGADYPGVLRSLRDALGHIVIAEANQDLPVTRSGVALTPRVGRRLTTRADGEHRFDIPLARVEQYALAAYNALGCSGHARPDLRISASGDAYVLEVNTLPGMTATSLLPKIAKSVGMDYATLCEQILASAK